MLIGVVAVMRQVKAEAPKVTDGLLGHSKGVAE